VIVDPGWPGDPRRDLRAALRDRLPAHLVPSDVVVVGSMPLTPNGKLDRAALPAPPRRAAGRAPCDDRERALCGLFARILDLAEVDPEEGFFDLGGDSLTAMRLVGAIDRELGATVEVSTLMARPSVAELAAHLSGADEEPDPERDHVLTLRARGSAEPLFCVHPAGGFAWPFAGLARVLTADRPLVGLQLPAPPVAAGSVAELAGHYVETVRGIQPHGPYHLLGYSFGGTVVQAMAAQLSAAGKTVAFAGLLDSRPAGIDPGADTEDDIDREVAAVVPAEIARQAPDVVDAVRAAYRECVRLLACSDRPDEFPGPLTLITADGSGGPGAPSPGDRLAAAWQEVHDPDRLLVVHLPTDHAGLVSPAGWALIGPLLDALPGLRTDDPAAPPTTPN
jgi:acyl carrier protein